ncbi:PaaI family thioesterase [Roseibium sp. RKSG952]|uniref:PaaI family thioesterase n=1 Tax=Roseibium sp. RKSG952 TaxID=2529384 RepID=UPI0012BB5DD4|nr:PaaI family thioesterase [Roseibium sp. RKSG952]MTH95339.1 PaaI family thioesterase [Roseibium sp. RKSG952]
MQNAYPATDPSDIQAAETESFPIPPHAAHLSSCLINHPYQQFCGLKVIAQRPGFCLARLTVTENIDNLGHTLHGGVIYSMLDVVSMLATLPLLDTGEYALTTSMSSSLMSPAPLGLEVDFEAEVRRSGRTAVFTEARAYKIKPDETRALIASALFTKSRFKRDLR